MTSLVPEPGALPSAHQIPQPPHDSEINFKIESVFDGVWTVTLGDEMNGWGDYSRRPNYADALLDLKDMAIERYPGAAFAGRFKGVLFLEDSPEELAAEVPPVLMA